MVQRLTYRRRHSYNTRSNKVKTVKTPGGRLIFHYRSKVANGPRCGDCGRNIQGVPHLRPREYSRLPKRSRRVTRAYGGSRCAKCVRDRIVRAFLIEEQRIVKKLMKAAQKKKQQQPQPQQQQQQQQAKE
jgi:large subunit ribosomal protein L34e